MRASPLHVVLIDSRDERRDLMVDVVEGTSGEATVVAVADGHDGALACVGEQDPDAVLIDVLMPTEEGLRTIRDLRRSFPRLGIVACSFDLDRRTVKQVLDEGADAYLAKPAGHRELMAAFAQACSPWQHGTSLDDLAAVAG